MFGLGISCGLKQRKLAAAVAAFSDDFESYTAGGADLFAQSDWTQARAQSTWTVSESLGNNLVSGNITSTGLDGALYTPAGNTYADGLIQCEVVISSTGHANTQPGLIARWVDVDNCVYCRLNNGSNNLGVVSRSSAVQTETTGAAVWSRGTTYYVDLLLEGATVTCTIYSDAERTTQVKQVVHTANHTAAGYMGMSQNAEATGEGHFDDWSFAPA